jgi:4-hydroxy-2-oxoheptanedioate aldolase
MSQSHKVTTASDSINAIKCKLANGQPVLGIWSIIPSPMVVEILSLSGFDFAILDMEHGVFDLTSLDSCIRAVEVAGKAPLVRIPGMNPSAAQWALDLGAHGIIVPQVRDAQDAAAVVNITKYAPLGQRGYNPFTRAANYANPANNRSGKLNNEFSLTCVIVESESALADLDAICVTQSIDVVYMGIYDLAVALGFNGDTLHPRVVEVVEHSISRIRASGKVAGMMVHNSADITRALSLGANFLVYGVDSFLIRDAASRAVDTLSCELDKISTRTETKPMNKEMT